MNNLFGRLGISLAYGTQTFSDITDKVGSAHFQNHSLTYPLIKTDDLEKC